MSQPPVRTNAFKVLVGNLAKLEGGSCSANYAAPAGAGMPTIGGELLRVGEC